MTNSVYQNENGFEVSNRGCYVEFSVNPDSSLTIHSDEEAGWNSQSTYFTLTEDEAKKLVAFLISKGY